MKRAYLAILFLFLPAISAAAPGVISSVQIAAQSLASSSTDIGAVVDRANLIVNKSWTFGTAASQSALVWHATRSVGPAASDSLDLAGGLTDAFGRTVSFSAVKGFVLENQATDTSLLIAPASSTAAPWASISSDSILIAPAGVFGIVSPTTGYPVGSGTDHIIEIDNPGTATASYRIWVTGYSN